MRSWVVILLVLAGISTQAVHAAKKGRRKREGLRFKVEGTLVVRRHDNRLLQQYRRIEPLDPSRKVDKQGRYHVGKGTGVTSCLVDLATGQVVHQAHGFSLLQESDPLCRYGRWALATTGACSELIDLETGTEAGTYVPHTPLDPTGKLDKAGRYAVKSKGASSFVVDLKTRKTIPHSFGEGRLVKQGIVLTITGNHQVHVIDLKRGTKERQGDYRKRTGKDFEEHLERTGLLEGRDGRFAFNLDDHVYFRPLPFDEQPNLP